MSLLSAVWLNRFRIMAGVAMVCAQAAGANFCWAQAAPVTYPVRGVVVDSLTHQPIARVLVQADSNAALTDNEGRFELNLGAGEIAIQVRRPGYADGPGENPFDGLRDRESHRVRVGLGMPELRFSLTPQASIVGRVTLANGDQAAGINFAAYRKTVDQGHEKWIRTNLAQTNSEGVFRLSNVHAPASYIVCSVPLADHEGEMVRRQTVMGYPSICYPGAAEFAAASALAIASGQNAEMEITLPREPFYPVSISVPNRPRGQGVSVEIFDQSGRSLDIPVRWNEGSGAADMELPNGNYVADFFSNVASPNNSRPESQFGRLEFRVANKPLLGLRTAMHPLPAIAVNVRDERKAMYDGGHAGPVSKIDGSPEQGDYPPFNLMLLPVSEVDVGPVGADVKRRGDSYSYSIDGVRPARYRVRAFGNNSYVSSITSGGVDLAREPLVVGPGSSTAPIEITLRNDWGTIHCTVNPDVAGSNASGMVMDASSPGEEANLIAYAIPLFPSSGFLPVASPQNVGELWFMQLTPGQYRVVVFDMPQEFDLDDAKAMARIEAKGKTVTVEPGGTANVELDLPRAKDEGPSQ